jgi:hypothetical protein
MPFFPKGDFFGSKGYSFAPSSGMGKLCIMWMNEARAPNNSSAYVSVVDTGKPAVPRQDRGEQDSRQRAAGASGGNHHGDELFAVRLRMYTALSQAKDRDYGCKKVSQRTRILKAILSRWPRGSSSKQLDQLASRSTTSLQQKIGCEHRAWNIISDSYATVSFLTDSYASVKSRGSVLIPFVTPQSLCVWWSLLLTTT